MLFASLVSSVFAASVAATGLSGIIHPLQDDSRFADTAGRNDISYVTGNPVLTGNVNVYYVYYGNWTTAQKDILEDFVNGVSSSEWYGITRKYYYQASEEATKEYVTGNVRLAGTTVDAYSRGKSISGNAIPDIIQEQINANKLPEDENGIYFFLHSGDVKERIRSDLGNAAFCRNYCGYHVSWVLESGKRIFYSQVGNPSACLSGCAPPQNRGVSPNGDVAVDAMVSVLAHELTEAVSDPWSDVNEKRAWQDRSGYENADKCAYKYGTISKTQDGSSYNTVIGDRKFLVQQNWDPVKQACASSA